mgnify:CR=1 FL=1
MIMKSIEFEIFLKILLLLFICLNQSDARRFSRTKRAVDPKSPKDGGVTYQASETSSYTKADYELSNAQLPELINTKDPNVRVFVACIDGTEMTAKDNTNVYMVHKKVEALNNPSIVSELALNQILF